MNAIRDVRLAVASEIEKGERGCCSAPRCAAATNDHKPYCMDHIGLMPYARRLVRSVACSRRVAGRAA